MISDKLPGIKAYDLVWKKAVLLPPNAVTRRSFVIYITEVKKDNCEGNWEFKEIYAMNNE